MYSSFGRDGLRLATFSDISITKWYLYADCIETL